MTTLYYLFEVLKGGPRSGNRGHAGRLGKRGGSAPRSNVPQNINTQKYVQEYLKDAFHPEEIKEALNILTDLVKDSPVAMRVPEDVLIRIIDDGKFKNQHESGTSEGYFDPDVRKTYEKKAFGDDLKNPSDFPTYAYVSTSKKGFHPDVYSYGGVKIVFKDEIKSRTTITAGDSLGMFGRGDATGSPLLKPNENSLNGNVHKLRAGKSGYKDLWYIEAQIHGALTVKDIKKVIISRHSPRLEDSLREQGIPFTVANHPTETEDTE